MRTAACFPRLGLGTVQFGLDYAISARETRPGIDEVRRILEVAHTGGITLLDTATRYGTAESVLGECLSSKPSFDIVTKTPAVRQARISRDHVAGLLECFKTSLEDLRLPSVYGLMAHWAPDLLAEGGDALFAAMQDLKAQGKVTKIGSSVYTAAHIDGLLDKFPIDIIQLPLNILDQRLIHGGQIRELAARGVEIHARSAFLKGLILAAPASLPEHFDDVRGKLSALRRLAAENGCTPYQLALGFLLAQPAFAQIIVGVTSAAQLGELLSVAPLSPHLVKQCSEFAIDDPAILDPNHWPNFKI